MTNWKKELTLKKEWGIGDLLERQQLPLQERVVYSHVEALSGKDIDNHISIRRGMRNILDDQEKTNDYLNAFFKELAPLSEDSYIFENILSDFEVRNPNDFITVEYKNQKKVYVRIRPGAGGIKKESDTNQINSKGFLSFEVLPIILKPQIFSAERELIKVLDLKDWHPLAENVFIYYDIKTDRYQAKIEVKIGEEVQEKFFTNNADFLDFQDGGYESGIELLKSISEDNDLKNSFLANVESLENITLEPVFEISTNEIVTKHIGFNISGELIMTSNPLEIRMKICSFEIDATDPDNINIINFEDERNFLERIEYKHDLTVIGTLRVKGDEIIEGQTAVADSIITVNNEYGEEKLDENLLSGIRVQRGTTEEEYYFVLRPGDETFVIGVLQDLQAVATRQDNNVIVQNAIPFWNNVQKRFDTSANLTWNNNNIFLNGSINNLTITTDSARTLTINNANKTIAGTGNVFSFNQNLTINLDSARTLTINNANKTIAGTGTVLTFGGGSQTSHTLTLNTTANTNITLPNTGTISTLEGNNSFSGNNSFTNSIVLPTSSKNLDNSIWIS
jgi:hypothetical protein